MPAFTDEQLAAYADGELPAAEARAVADATRADPALARRLAAFTETRRVLRDAFADTVSEPVPERLLDVLREPTVARGPRRVRFSMPLAMAASLAIGIGVSAVALRVLQPAPGLAVAGLPLDAAALAHALDSRKSGEPATIDTADGRFEVLPTATLEAAPERYCREFEAARDGAPATRAVACRDGDGDWRLVAVAAAAAVPAADGGYQPAAGAAPDLAALLGNARRLTPDEEDALLSAHWRAPAR